MLLLVEYGYIRNNLAHLGGYPNHQDDANMLNLFSLCVYMTKGDDALAEISPFKVKWDEQNRYKRMRI